MAINKRQLKKQIEKMKRALSTGEAEDWCDELTESDYTFITCLVHSLKQYDIEELKEEFKELGIHNYIDLVNEFAEELGITGGVEDIE